MNKQKARQRQAAQDARARASAPDSPMADDDQVDGMPRRAAMSGDDPLAEQTPTGALSELAEDEDDLDPVEREMRAEQQAQAEAERQARLDAFANALAAKRRSAVDSRRASGIEDIWTQDEEHYEGIDDANRDEMVTLKPRNQTGGASTSSSGGGDTGSTLFVNITRAYVDFSAGRAADMLLPTDDPNWDLKETPMPDIIALMGSDEPITPPPGITLKPGAPSTIGQAATKMVEQAQAQVAKAKKRIEDFLEEGQYYAEQRKVLRDAAKVGVGVLKGPFPKKSMARVISRGEDGQIAMKVQNKLAPVSRCISYWNFFPDPACGEDIHSGSFVWERDTITARRLRDLKGTRDADGAPMYIESAIDTCLREGPQRKFENETTYEAKDAENYDIWYYNGVATADDLRAAGIDADEGEVLPVMVTMVNDRVIKAALTTLDSGEFPYDVMVWQEREGNWAGIGVCRQVRTPQRIVNAGVRNLMDNAGLAAGPQFVVMKEALKPMGRSATYGIAPRKMWEVNPDSNVDDVRKAFAAIELPMLTNDLLAIVQFGLKMAEDVTGMPMLMQGQQGQASDTVGGMQMLTNNSNTPMRAIAKLFDDKITVPHLLRYYEWLLLYGPDDSEKGEFVVAARGSSALFERDAQNQAIMQMGALLQNPANPFRLDPQKWIKEAMRAQRLDPARFQYSDTEWQQIQQQQSQQQPPVEPTVQAAQINAASREKIAGIQASLKAKQISSDADRDAIFAKNEAERTQVADMAAQREADNRIRLALMQYANDRNISLDQAKVQLSETAMKLNAQERLSMMSSAADLHKHHNPSPQVITPPTEPAGRAPNGEAFQA